MNTKGLIITIILSLFIVSCKDKDHPLNDLLSDSQHENIYKKNKKHWSYHGETGPEHWAELEKGFVCEGLYQSPINIISTDVVTDTTFKPLKIHYFPTTIINNVINNGHTIQYNFEHGDYLKFNGEKFELMQIHFHEPAEHTINGIRYPLEMHMVHLNKNNQLAVLSIMAQEGISSKPFDFLEDFLPIDSGEKKNINASFDLNLNLPKNKKYYNYVGSLTTPPCSEGVNWFIFQDPITISLEQVKTLQKLMPLNNYRDEQPLNGRIVKTPTN